MKKIKFYEFKEWLRNFLTREVVKQERSLRWKLSHYFTKLLIVFLVAQIVSPYLISNLAEAGENIEHGKVLGASVTKLTNKIADPLYGHFKMEDKLELENSFTLTTNLTNSYIKKIDQSIQQINKEKESIRTEIEKTKKEIAVMKSNLSELIYSISNEMEITLFEQLLTDESFSKIDTRMAENELVFKDFKDVLDALRRKQETLEILIEKIEQEDFVLDQRKKEKQEQLRQLDALSEGKKFFQQMGNTEYQNFLQKEKSILNEFDKEKIEDPKANLAIINQVISTQVHHFEDLQKIEELKMVEIEHEIQEIEHVSDEISEADEDTKLEDLLNVLNSLESQKDTAPISKNYFSKFIPEAYALSDKALSTIKKQLQKSTKLTLIEKNKVLQVKNEKELKKFLVQVVTRLKQEKESVKKQTKDNISYASKITQEISESLKVFEKIVPGKSLFSKHPLVENPVLITAEYGSKTYEKAVGMFHNGVDMAVPQGTPIYAVSDGVVKSAIFDTTPSLAYLILIHSKENRMSAYLHLSKIMVKDLDIIKAGQLIAYSGGTPGTFGAGLSTGPHLHFEIRQMDNIRINPYPAEIPGSPPVLKFIGF